MTTEEAKRILLGYRPGSRDQYDPDLAAALDLVQGDHELEQWLAEQQAFDRQVRAVLRQLEVPGKLKSRILAQKRVIVPLWRRSEFLLAAACLALGLIVAALWLGAPRVELSFAGFRSRMVGFALREYRMDIVTTDDRRVREFLASHEAPADYVLTPGLKQLPTMGGARLSWQTNPVSMVCFRLPKEQSLFMFVMDQRAVRGAASPGSIPEFVRVKDLMTASWRQNGKLYLIAAEDAEVVAKSVPL